MTNLNFREALITDLPKLLKLEQKIIESERPYSASIKENNVSYYDLNSLISEPDSYLIVLESESRVIGSGYAQIRPSKSHQTHDNHCYLGFIYLEPEYRGKALGRAIIDVLKDWGVSQGMQHFYLDVFSKNESAIRAYEKIGFNKLSVKMELIV